MPRTNTKRRYGAGSVSRYTNTTKAGKVTKWRWMLWIPEDPEQPEGKQQRLTRGGFSTAAKAEAALQAKQQELSECSHVSNQPPPTLAQFAQEWLNGRRLAPATIAGYRKILGNHIIPQVGEYALPDLTSRTIEAHYRGLLQHGRSDGKHKGEPLSPNTVAKVHNVLAAILDAAVKAGHVRVNAAKQADDAVPTSREIKAAQSEVQTWTAPELSAFLEWDRDVFRDDLHVLWLVIASTGMRRSEALALKWQDFDSRNQRIAVRRAADTATARAVKVTKTGSARVVDLPTETAAALKSWKDLRRTISADFAKADAYIFGNLDGELRSPNEVGRRWRFRVAKAQEALPDLPTVTLKGLRHTHATLLLQAGVQPKVVQERLGHSSIQITMSVYSHVMPSMQREALERLSALMAP